MIHSTRLSALLATAVLVLAGLSAGGAVAQEIPEGQSCGGLVCDLGLFGHKVPPKPTAAVPTTAVTQPAPVPTRAAARPEPDIDSEPRKPVARKRARVAKAVAATTPASVPAVAMPARVTSAKATPTLGAPPVAATLAPAPLATQSVSALAPASSAPSPIDVVLGPQPEAASLTPVPAGQPAVAPPPPPEEPVVLANPYVYTRPLSFQFQSVDPNVH